MVSGFRACAISGWTVASPSLSFLIVAEKLPSTSPRVSSRRPRRARRPHRAGIDGFTDVGGARVSGTDLDAARAALDEGQGLPSPLFWTPVSLAILYRGRVNTWHLGRRPAGRPSLIPSRFSPPPVFPPVVAALAEAFLRGLAHAAPQLRR